MLVRDVMTSPAIALHEDDHVRRAAQVLLENRIASAPVVDGDGELVGFVSEIDLVRGRTSADPRAHLRPVAQAADPTALTVAGVMTRNVLSIRADEDVAEVARLVLAHGIKALPVVQGRRVVGIVARRDLLRSLARDDEAVVDDVRQVLGDLGIDHDWQVAVHDGVVTLTGPGDAGLSRAGVALAGTVPGVVRIHVVEPPS